MEPSIGEIIIQQFVLNVRAPHMVDARIPVKEVARRLDVSVAALYHHFPGGRSALLANENGLRELTGLKLLAPKL